MKTLTPIFLLIIISALCCAPAHSEVWRGHLSPGIHDSFTGPRKWVWLLGGAATLVAAGQDKYVYRAAIARPDWEPANKIGDIWGSGLPGVGIALATSMYGWLATNSNALSAGTSHFESLASTAVVTLGLKAIVERDRSSGFTSGETPAIDSSFPSGHTSTGFATAANLAAHFGWGWSLPAFALSAVTGFSRVQRGAHYLSDVLFGATIGTAFGFGFAQHHIHSESSTLVQIVPYYETSRQFGLRGVLSW